MSSNEPDFVCERARRYYYDYLQGRQAASIPDRILAHIYTCDFCRAEVDRLEASLADAEDRATQKQSKQTISDAVTNLRLHFAYQASLVSCKTVRPFLATLAIPEFDVGVATPITVHIAKCKQCTDDFETIRDLGLTAKQLCRLAQLFAEGPAAGATSCSQAQTDIVPVATMAFERTNADVLKHYCTCPDCRQSLYQYRQAARPQMTADDAAREHFQCEEIAAADIFDYCLPYGVDPAANGYAKMDPALKSHLRGCPTCMEKMLQLHRTIYDIAQRGVAITTRFTVRAENDRAAQGRDAGAYARSPITVEVFDQPARETQNALKPQPATQRAAKPRFRRLFITSAAAAVIVIAVLLSSLQTAGAVGLSEIYQALAKIKNVYTSTFYGQDPNPVEERLISRALNIKMLKNNAEWVLWDLPGNTRKARNLHTGTVTSTELDNNVAAKVKESMRGTLGLLPFTDMANAPQDAQWTQVSAEDLEFGTDNTQAYELLWTQQKGDGSVVFRKWRGHVDLETRLPKTVELWERRAWDEDYELQSITKVSYPITAEVQAKIDALAP
ncbi:MAG: hypothetical protein ACYTEX_05535 [Planctomycetota bacterium]|jgi:hypothetical protein